MSQKKTTPEVDPPSETPERLVSVRTFIEEARDLELVEQDLLLTLCGREPARTANAWRERLREILNQPVGGKHE